MFHARILRYLDEVVRSGSIRRAAEKLNVASSAINRQILALEDELGTPLFQRLPRRMRLTTAGEILIGHVRQTLKEHDRALERILDLRGLRSGEVRLAAMNGLVGGLLPRLILQFRETHPRVRIALKSLFADEIVKAVREGDVDLGLGYNLKPDPALHVIAIFQTRLGVVMAPDHALAGHDSVRLSDCAGHPIVLADESLTIHQIVHSAFRRARLDVMPQLETNSIEMMKLVARQSQALTFLSASDVFEDTRAGALVFKPISGDPIGAQPLVLVQRADASLDRSPSLFAEKLREALDALLDA